HTRAVLSEDAVASSVPSGENATPDTWLVWPVSVERGVPAGAFQIRAVRSREAGATRGPSPWETGENATPEMPCEWAVGAWWHGRVAVSQIRVVPSYEAVAIKLPSAENATADTSRLCAARTNRVRPVAVSQIRAVRSYEAVAIRVLSAENATPDTLPVWP